MDRQSYKKFYETALTEHSPEEGEQYYRNDQFFNVQNFISKGFGKESNILDVGCGNWYKLAPFTGDNVVCGIDISESNTKKTITKRIKAKLHDVEDPFPLKMISLM